MVPLDTEYNARHLSVLEGLEAVRKRPGMYIGSTDSRGLMHCLWEIIDNSVDEALAGYGQSIRIILHADNSVEIHDDGRGIPVDIEPKTGLSGVEVVFTKLHAGGKFGGGSYAASGGLHGVGASVVNALSSRLDVQVDRAGKTYQMTFRRGEPGTFADTGSKPSPDAKFTPFLESSKLEVVGKAKRGVTGTRIRYWADRQIFTPDAKFSYTELEARARQTSFLVPGLRITLRDERRLPGTPGEDGPVEEVFHHDGGISEFVEFLAADAPVTDIWRLHGSGKFKESVPVLDERGHSQIAEVERECEVDIALRWGIGYETTTRSFVNIIATPKGGTHQAGFEQALLKTFRKVIEANARKLKAGNDKIEKDDVFAGLTAVLTVRLAEPQFEGQTKEILGTSAVRAIVAKVVEKEISARLNSTARGDKAQTALLLEKVVSEMKSRISARVHKETQRRKNALETSSMPVKLADCRIDDAERSELFIVEGDSALGTAKMARSSDYQALLPIRGKILNVQKASVSDMLSNAECAALIQVVGAGSGRSFQLEAARYGKVIFMTDADVDGAHIRTLLLTLFFRYMRPLVEAGRVYAAVPPLHRVEVINHGSKANEMVYTYSEKELHQLLARLEKEGKRYKEPIQRYKGLGEMDADQLAETTMDPRHRTLRRIRLSEAAEADRTMDHVDEATFELLMGSDVAPRKDFIIAGAAMLDRDRIDA
ncbi:MULTISPECIES: DNA gyrase/topoisomerase IV subunit B [Arthrobacter]|uniref:DNA topoisomerase (ATP-hydrolyzing) n=1 Tax=Arthrobacter caoxuetaonis TaxID=2886935 RepID=A0A9X1MFD3_9MICC|nr:DNA topoisomerase IV subunit B [Arthrobacter caoxuetaonis]MCC3283755.1 type IIA DNA topoisomerase subunit B [Arthrobacter caoxuetaonis]MCC3299103.1 type IIA DNA topoisomerase subunit B [Arthrobacter caoxuetaonis]MCC9193192.1 type IIA DNA topoisomerase subunit B [Arthrobacter sp. zg-Y916]USQ58564.1 type IIA DNA topoisomerase subunit B [Arthrobacter caoxuetaonis]